MAIRAPMMVEPSAATDVFAVAAADSTIPQHNSSFPVDMAMKRNVSVSDGMSIGARMVGTGRMLSTTTAAETTVANNTWDFMDGWSKQATANAAVYSWMWKRAKGFMDVVAYTASSSAAHTVNHSLGVPPELLISRRRQATMHWYAGQVNNYLRLNTDGGNLGTPVFNNYTSTTYYVTAGTFDAGDETINYLFASLDGISKVGSYIGNGSSQTISCGFSAGSRFILIKRTDDDGDWYLWDSLRGIVAADDPSLSPNTTTEQENENSVGPHNSGFIVNQVSTGGATNINVSSATYIFYAIA
jgi:hypothetical protein